MTKDLWLILHIKECRRNVVLYITSRLITQHVNYISIIMFHGKVCLFEIIGGHRGKSS